MLKDLVAFANHLDSIGLTKEADEIDALLEGATDGPVVPDSSPANPGDDPLELAGEKLEGSAPDTIVEKVQNQIEKFLSSIGFAVDENGELLPVSENRELLPVENLVSKAAEENSGTPLAGEKLSALKSVLYYLWRAEKDKGMIAALISAAIVGGIYLASPIDIIPDFIPGLGQADDFFAFIYAIKTAAWVFDNKDWTAATSGKQG